MSKSITLTLQQEEPGTSKCLKYLADALLMKAWPKLRVAAFLITVAFPEISSPSTTIPLVATGELTNEC